MHCTSSCHTPWTRCCYPHLTDEETKHKRFDNLQKDHKCHSWGSNLDLPGSFGQARYEEKSDAFHFRKLWLRLVFHFICSFHSSLDCQSKSSEFCQLSTSWCWWRGARQRSLMGYYEEDEARLGTRIWESPHVALLMQLHLPVPPWPRPLSQSLLSPTPLSVTLWEEGKQTILMYRGSLGAEFSAGKITRKSHGRSD